MFARLSVQGFAGCLTECNCRVMKINITRTQVGVNCIVFRAFLSPHCGTNSKNWGVLHVCSALGNFWCLFSPFFTINSTIDIYPQKHLVQCSKCTYFDANTTLEHEFRTHRKRQILRKTLASLLPRLQTFFTIPSKVKQHLGGCPVTNFRENK